MPPDQESQPPARASRRVKLAVAVLLAAFAVQAVLSLRQKSVTVDEIMYFAGGYYHWQTGDFEFNMTNPPLMKLVTAAPLLLLKPNLPEIESPPRDWSLVRQWHFARSFLYDNRVDADRMLFGVRLPVVALGVVLGLFVFRWSAELYGSVAGLLSLSLYAFSPNMLAHTRLATHDLGIAAFMFLAAYFFWRYVRHPSIWSLVLCGVFVGLSALTKTTAMFLAPIFGVYVLIGLLRGDGSGVWDVWPAMRRIGAHRVRARQLLGAVWTFVVIGLVALIVLNAGYGFQGVFEPYDAAYKSAGTSLAGSLKEMLYHVPLPLPGPFVELVKFQAQITVVSGDIFFAGQIHEHGLWYLIPAALAIKTPLGSLLLMGLALAAMLRRVRTLEGEWLLAAFVAIIMFVFSYLSHVSIGLRYVLPVYPFLHVMVGRLCRSGVNRSKPALCGIAALVIWQAASSLWVHPHYLAYFNEAIGGPKNGYKWLVDSNLDWGQDLKGLKEYIEEHGIERIKLGYFGSADADYYGIDYDYLPSVGLAPKQPGETWWYELSPDNPATMQPQTGLIAVSATLLQSSYWMAPIFRDAYAWLREHEPIDTIGYSILIYRIE